MRMPLWQWLVPISLAGVALAAWAETGGPQVFETRCSVCGKVAARIELRGPAGARKLIYKGILAGNASGDPVTDARAQAIGEAFTPPYQTKKIKAAKLHDDAGWCEKCQAFYCIDHWNPTRTGGGWCPKRHLKILDPGAAFD